LYKSAEEDDSTERKIQDTVSEILLKFSAGENPRMLLRDLIHLFVVNQIEIKHLVDQRFDQVNNRFDQVSDLVNNRIDQVSDLVSDQVSEVNNRIDQVSNLVSEGNKNIINMLDEHLNHGRTGFKRKHSEN
jgi:transcriptional regulator of heat shock response